MPELDLAQTGCLATGLLLSLVLPLMMSIRVSPSPAGSKAFVKIVWCGQILLALAGLAILIWPTFFLFSAWLGLVSYFLCACFLHRKLRERNQR